MKIRNNKAFKCRQCGRVTYPQRAVCLKCKGRDFEEIPFGEECTLLTFSQIFQLPWGIDERFLTIGISQFDNGIKAMGLLTTPDVENGIRMKAYWKLFRQISGEDVCGWVFEPVTEVRN